jgi:hypothetical protein
VNVASAEVVSEVYRGDSDPLAGGRVEEVEVDSGDVGLGGGGFRKIVSSNSATDSSSFRDNENTILAVRTESKVDGESRKVVTRERASRCANRFMKAEPTKSFGRFMVKQISYSTILSAHTGT